MPSGGADVCRSLIWAHPGVGHPVSLLLERFVLTRCFSHRPVGGHGGAFVGSHQITRSVNNAGRLNPGPFTYE